MLKKKKLELKSDRIRVLSNAELAQLKGGDGIIDFCNNSAGRTCNDPTV